MIAGDGAPPPKLLLGAGANPGRIDLSISLPVELSDEVRVTGEGGMGGHDHER
jgi:hypothetical protein